jgi:LysR family transcriptional regulator, glycine cleavage system transcriptional activator
MKDDPGLSWSQLRAFEACARMLHFNAAALKLSVSTSAVRFQVGLLESRLGVRLFERQGGRLALTDIGRDFARDVARPMQELLVACEAAQQSASEVPLTLTAPPLFARQFLLDEHFLKWCDVNKVQLDVSDNKRDLLGPGLIAAIRLGAQDHPDLVDRPLLDVELCIVAAPYIASGAKPHDASWWGKQSLLTPSASLDGWKLAWQALGIGVSLSPRIVPFTSYAAALEAACAGNGLILAPLPFAEREIDGGRLTPISAIRIPADYGYSLIMRQALATATRGRNLTRKLVRVCGVPE